MPVTPIKTERLELIPASLRLVELELSDLATFADELAAVVPDDWPPEAYREVIPYFRDYLQDFPQGNGWTHWYWIVTDPKTGERTLIGGGGFKCSEPVDGEVETGYGILPRFWNSGYTTEAMQALMHWAFSQDGLQQIYAEVQPDNPASIRVLEKNGFIRDGYGEEEGSWRYIRSSSTL